MMWHALATICLGAAVAAATPASAGSLAGRSMIEVTLEGRRVEGTAIAWNPVQVVLMGRDGRLWEFPPERAGQFRKTAENFRGLPISELRAILLRELGAGYEVSGTRHYVVAHPQGQQDRWAKRFEDLYGALVHYFLVRGFTLTEPDFPLIGVVCRSHEDFRRQSALQGTPAGSGVLGFYSLQTNRILLYDVTAGRGPGADWRQNAATVIHEATHQTAFNVGIHTRFCPPPTWVAEGLATMFEAPGVYDCKTHLRQSDRLNRGRLENFRQHVLPRHRPEMLADLVRSDRLFQSDPQAAYAEAWAFSFYLVETQPRKYAEYLLRTARRQPFTEYSPAQRTADFAAVFGTNWPILEAHFLQYLKKL